MSIDREFQKPFSMRYSDELARTQGGDTTCRTSEATRAKAVARASKATRGVHNVPPNPPTSEGNHDKR
jgi:hypothetical protein